MNVSLYNGGNKGRPTFVENLVIETVINSFKTLKWGVRGVSKKRVFSVSKIEIQKLCNLWIFHFFIFRKKKNTFSLTPLTPRLWLQLNNILIISTLEEVVNYKPVSK